MAHAPGVREAAVLDFITTHENNVKERLSLTYLVAIAAMAGCHVTVPDLDYQSIDATVRPVRGKKIVVDFQLKATSKDEGDSENLMYPLPINNYNHLRDPETTVPHYLLVLVLPDLREDWCSVSVETLLVKGKAYWTSLLNWDDSPNTSTVRVPIPRSRIFNVDALNELMSAAYKLVRVPGREEAR